MAFARGRPCPYTKTPCLVLNRTETALIRGPRGPDTAAAIASIFAEVQQRMLKLKDYAVIDFDGRPVDFTTFPATPCIPLTAEQSRLIRSPCDEDFVARQRLLHELRLVRQTRPGVEIVDSAGATVDLGALP